MFDDFETTTLETAGGAIHARVGGDGPPLLLLHGYPQSHMMWHAAARELAQCFTVVASDLTGYGSSAKPPSTEDHAPYSKRAMARNQVEAMGRLGFDAFFVAGHDRGGRCAYRMALDHPERVRRLAVLDVVPTGEALARVDLAFGLGYWHWFFLAQPAPLPEKLIAGDPDAFFSFGGALGLGSDEEHYPPEVMAAYRRALHDPATVHAMCEDYRAGASIDRKHDEADRGRHRIACPLLALWGARGKLDEWYDVLAIWGEWAADVRGRSVDASHFLVEDRPEEVAEELRRFFLDLA